jgi:transcription initiation factor IIE alpha subunit
MGIIRANQGAEEVKDDEISEITKIKQNGLGRV